MKEIKIFGELNINFNQKEATMQAIDFEGNKYTVEWTIYQYSKDFDVSCNFTVIDANKKWIKQVKIINLCTHDKLKNKNNICNYITTAQADADDKHECEIERWYTTPGGYSGFLSDLHNMNRSGWSQEDIDYINKLAIDFLNKELRKYL